MLIRGIPRNSVGKESACNAADMGSISELGRSPGEGNGNPLQCSYLENLMHRGAWQATSMASQESDTKEQLCTVLFTIGSNSWVRKIPWRRGWLPTLIFFSGEFHGQKSLMGYSSWGHKESDMTERLTQHDPITYVLTTWRSEVKSFSRVRLFAIPWTICCQAPPSIGFSRQEYWSGLPFPLYNSLTMSLTLKNKNWAGWSVVSFPVLESIHFS